MMDHGDIAARLFGMDERTWERHASPWSVWTRVASLPLLLIVIWSHSWLGAWTLLPIILMVLWLWLNPRLFPPPARTDRWSSKATFGERVWLNRKTIAIPEHHARMAQILTFCATLGFLTALAGAYLNNVFMTVSGAIAAWFSKMWFCDRMVWLYEDMRGLHTAYAGWLRSGKEQVR